jgi:hypothetical protein
MFEQAVADGGGLADDGAALLEDDRFVALTEMDPWEVPDRTEAEWQALTARAVAADPEQRPAPSPEQVIEAGIAAPVSVTTIAGLDGLSPVELEGLDDFDLVDLAVGWSRAGNACQVGRVDAIGRLLARATVQPEAWVDAPGRVAAQVGAALRLGPVQAARLVTGVLQVTGPLSATLASARRGDIPWTHVEVLADATIGMDDDKARQVEARVLPHAAARTLSQHRAAVQRAVDRIDPDRAKDRRRRRQRDIALLRTHLGDGMAEVWAQMPSEDADVLWTAADVAARRWKAAGDPRSLDLLRVAVLVHWASTYLLTGTHLDPDHPTTGTDVETVQDSARDDASAQEDDSQPTGRRDLEGGIPVRHGRAVRVGLIWDLASLLGLAAHSAELLDSGATLPTDVAAGMVARGIRVRRMLIDPDTGELLDLTPTSWTLPAATPAGDVDGDGYLAMASAQVFTLGLIVDADLRDALVTGDITGLPPDRIALVDQIAAALDNANPATAAVLRALLAHPVTADDLDSDPDAETPSPALAEFVCVRDRHPTNPNAPAVAAHSGDIDHTVARSQGGKTVRANLTPLQRRWHLLKTHHDWTVDRVARGWRWTSPEGHAYLTEPYDYRLGP